MGVWAGCSDGCMGWVYGMGVGMGVWAVCRDRFMGWVYGIRCIDRCMGCL